VERCEQCVGRDWTAPDTQCKIRNDTSYAIAFKEMAKWDAVFLKDAHNRLKGKMEGYDLSLKDVKDFVSS
jgi:hypothetical protein